MDITTFISKIDALTIVGVIVVVEALKALIKKDAFKTVCPYIVPVLSVATMVVYAYLNGFDYVEYAVKGIVDGGLAVMMYDAILDKVKKADITGKASDMVKELFTTSKKAAEEAVGEEKKDGE